MEKIKFTIKPNTIARNELHFNVQQKTRATIFKPKKGKGSFKRNKLIEYD